MEAGEARFEHLREHSIGLPQVLFQSITHMAPAAAVAYSIFISVPQAQQALPLSVGLALIACMSLLVGAQVSRAQVVSELPEQQKPEAARSSVADYFDPANGLTADEAVARALAGNGELAALHTARVRHCFSHYLDVLLRAQRLGQARIGLVSIQSGNPPAPGASGSFGWRVTARFRLLSVRVPFYLDLLGFVLGPARVTLISSGALRPFPAQIQQRLYTSLLARAREHAL